MKIIILSVVLAVCSIGFTSCSKCYDCVEYQIIYDNQGNEIDRTEVHEEVCTVSNQEIQDREINGAVCSQ